LISPANGGEREDFIVNDDGGTQAQKNPRVAVASDGSFVITWVDYRDVQSDIYYQRYDSTGYPVGINLRLNDDLNDAYQFEPAIAVDYSGRYSVVWNDYRTFGYPFNPDIYFQRFDSIAALSGANLIVNNEVPDTTVENPDLDLYPDGHGVVVWSDYRNRNWDIYGQIINADGSAIGSNFRANTDAGSYQQHAPKVSVAADGWFVVAWYDNRNGNDDIYVQGFDSTGTKIGNNIKVNQDATTSRQAFPDIATDGQGHFTVVWVDWRNGNYPKNPDIYARKFDQSMVALTDEYRLNSDTLGTTQKEPCIASDRQGNTAIIWSDSTGASWNITGQMVDADGIVREENFLANRYGDSLQLHPNVAVDGRYRYVVWADKRNGNFDIYASITEYNNPSLSLSTELIEWVMEEGGLSPDPTLLLVEHLGYNPLNISIEVQGSFVTASPMSGTTPETITVSLNNPNLAEGTYFGAVTVIDNVTSSKAVTANVKLIVLPYAGPIEDTLLFESANTVAGQWGVTSLRLKMLADIAAAEIPFRYDPALITADSMILYSSSGSAVSDYEIDAINGIITLSVSTPDNSAAVDRGNFVIADFYFTAGPSMGVVTLDTVNTETSATRFTRMSGSQYIPVVIPGTINIGLLTDVNDNQSGQLPDHVRLFQNYPNPFNPSTVIAFDLPARARAKVEIININGQVVAAIVDREFPAGHNQVSWDGKVSGAEAAATGVYFYRLTTNERSMVRKMILLK
jgi:hypothetical protein